MLYCENAKHLAFVLAGFQGFIAIGATKVAHQAPPSAAPTLLGIAIVFDDAVRFTTLGTLLMFHGVDLRSGPSRDSGGHCEGNNEHDRGNEH